MLISLYKTKKTTCTQKSSPNKVFDTVIQKKRKSQHTFIGGCGGGNGQRRLWLLALGFQGVRWRVEGGEGGGGPHFLSWHATCARCGAEECL